MWTVLWTTTAEEELATIWAESSDREAITASANAIDRELRTSPETAGESRETEVDRLLRSGPLGARFTLVPDDRIVRVLQVWRVAPS